MSIYFEEQMREMRPEWASVISFEDMSGLTDIVHVEMERVSSMQSLECLSWSVRIGNGATIFYREDIQKFQKILSNNRNLQTIYLSGFCLTPLMDILPNEIGSHKKLTRLVLRHFTRPFEYFQDFISYLKGNCFLKELTLSDVHLTSAQLVQLADVIVDTNVIHTFYFDLNRVEAAGEHLAKKLLSSENYTLTSINLEYTFIPPHVEHIIVTVCNANALMTAMLQGMIPKKKPFPVSLFGWGYVRFYNCPLKKLQVYFDELAGNCYLDRVTTVFIFNTPLTYEFLEHWFCERGHGRHIEKLTLIKCGVSEGIFAHYNEFFSNFPVLKHINISDYNDVA